MQMSAAFRSLLAAQLLIGLPAAGLAQTGADRQSTDAGGDASINGAETLTIASWGGAYSQSQNIAFFQPFQRETGIKINLVTHGGKLTKLKNAATSSASGWDVVDLGFAAIENACRDGLLETMDAKDLMSDGRVGEANADFLPGALHACGVASVAWSSVIVFDKRAFKKRSPTRAEDLFDLKRFPGKRVLSKGPRYTLELALMADGVAPEDVYKTLSTDAGVTRAFAMLDRIKDAIIWSEGSHEPLKLLKDRKAAMAVAFNGRAFNVIVGDHQPFGLVWDAQIYDLDFWAIPKGATRKAAARKFIAFAIRPDRLAEQTRWFPYGPMRKSALALIGKHAEVNVDMSPYVPTVSSNFQKALKTDGIWWSDRKAELEKHFSDWLEGKPISGGDAAAEPSSEPEKSQ
ncbi:MAG: extracellular solute-binding protein [Methyloligellaceae bacterium]